METEADKVGVVQAEVPSIEVGDATENNDSQGPSATDNAPTHPIINLDIDSQDLTPSPNSGEAVTLNQIMVDDVTLLESTSTDDVTVSRPPTTLSLSNNTAAHEATLSDQSIVLSEFSTRSTGNDESSEAEIPALPDDSTTPAQEDDRPSELPPPRGGSLSQRDLEELPSALDWEEVSSEASDAINNVVENIVDRMRIERMFELRRIQFGDRAVSTGETAQRLEELFSESSTRPDHRPHRSDVVRTELEELNRTQSVGNLLNTRFRTLLESSLSVPPRTAAAGSEQRPSRPVTSSQPLRRAQSPVAWSADAPIRSASAPIPRPPPAPISRDIPAPPAEREHTPSVRDSGDPDRGYQPPDYSDRQFDYAITDVEELFQRRLVSDVLHSAFRNVLELHIERRLLRSGARRGSGTSTLLQQQTRAPGPQPQQQSRTGTPLPQQQLPQQQQSRSSFNPFRQPQAAISPMIAGPSSSRRLPEIERQIHTMSTEMKEMKSMLKLLVDTQLDIQRSIRQEVNALMTKSTATPAPPTPLLRDGTCVVCLEVACDTVLYRCGHLCCCYNCARSLRVAGHHCPVCRAEVADILRIYRSTNE